MKKKMILLFSVIIIVMTGCASVEKGEDEMAEVKTAVFEGGKMDYIVFGSGEKAFVILPGLAVHSVMSLGNAVHAAYSSFCDEYTVYLFDRTEHIGEGYSIGDLAHDTALALEAIGVKNADVFGASQGGMMAISLAIEHPELVHKLILGSTLSRVNETFLTVASVWLEKAEKRDEEGLLAAFVDSVYSENTLSQYRETLMESNRGITEEEWKRFIILASSCLEFDSYDELGKIQCPVLVLGSEGDRVVTAEASREIASVLNCELHIYPSVYGHAVYDEAPDYRSRCLEFLRK